MCCHFTGVIETARTVGVPLKTTEHIARLGPAESPCSTLRASLSGSKMVDILFEAACPKVGAAD